MPSLARVLSLLLLCAACSDHALVGPPTPPFTPPSAPPAGPATAVHAGLVALAAGNGAVRVDWDLPEGDHEAALFHAADRQSLLTGPPERTGLTGGGAVIGGLANGEDRLFALAIAPRGTADWTQAGPVLLARPGPPIFVDAAAVSQAADGTTPVTAFPTLAEGLFQASLARGGNVWVRDGEYTPGPLSLDAGVHVFGGFGADFDLQGRDAAGGRTVLRAAPDEVTFEVRGDAADGVLDGLVLDGGGTASGGIIHENRSLELRSVTVRGFRSGGIASTSRAPVQVASLLLVNCWVHENGSTGLFLTGAFALRLDACRFDSNVGEGMRLEIGAPDGGLATLEVSDSRFYGNGGGGLFAHLVPGPPGSLILATVRGSRLWANQGDGLTLASPESETPSQRTRIVVRETDIRNNRGIGLKVDGVDFRGCLLHRLAITGNTWSGLSIGAFLTAGHAVVSGCHIAGNLGSGIAADSHVVVFATHCVFAGNRYRGVSSSFPSAVNSSIAHLQLEPWWSSTAVGNAVIDDPTVPVFVNAPRGYGIVLSAEETTLRLEMNPGLQVGATVELAGDGVPRTVTAVNAVDVQLDSLPDDLVLPASLAVFPFGAVERDLQLVPGSPARGTGMTPNGGSSVHSGVYGGAAAGTPGVADPVLEPLFWPERMEPVSVAGMYNSSPVTIEFNRELDLASVTPDQVRVTDLSGVPRPVTVAINGHRLVLTPPTGGWGNQLLRVELHRGLRAADGTALSTPLLMILEPGFRQ